MYIVIKDGKWFFFQEIRDALKFSKEDRLTVYELRAIDNVLLFPEKKP